MNIPAKEWNAMKGKMEDTSSPEWQEYYRKLAEFQEMMAAKRPKRENYKSHDGFNKAVTEWMVTSSLAAPNKPGYYRANND